MTIKPLLFVLFVVGCSSTTAPSKPHTPSYSVISVIEPTGVLEGIVNTQTGPFAVRVTDSVTGQTLSGVVVNWSISQGAGSLPMLATKTDSSGITTNTMIFDIHPGPAEITAALGGGRAVRFTVAAVPGPIATVQSAVGQLPNGTPGGTESIGVTVTDEFGNGVSRALVHFVTTDGTVGDSVTNTDGNGRAFTQWTLPSHSGAVVATAIVVPLAPVNFTTTLAP